MENSSPPPAETPTCTIDRRLPNKTYISAWRDKSEFQSVYDKIFNTAPDDIAAKEDALEWLNLWKVRQVMDFPICVRCTHLVLDAQVFDLRCQRNSDGAEANATEIKNIYAGAFTRFINFLTEAVGNKRKSIADSVREIGIETYLVELRHLCAHRSVSISIDVFRRSAQYCMDWLKGAYWERELATMAPVVNPSAVMNCHLSDDYRVSDVVALLRMYDALAAALVREAYSLEQAAECAELTADEKLLLGACSEKYDAKRLSVIVKQVMRELRELRLPPNQATVNAVCKAVFDHCRRMFADTARLAENDRVPMGKIHSELFRTLAAIGCLQTFFEQLMVLCEQHGSKDMDERPVWAGYWAHRIAVAFQLLKQFKRACRILPPGKVARFGDTTIPDRYASNWYRERLGAAAKQHLVLGMTIDCPWHLSLSRAYVLARVRAMNEHTKDTVPVLLALLEPPLPAPVQQKINQLTQIYNKANLALFDDSPNNSTTDGSSVKAKETAPGPVSDEVYTAEDLREMLRTKRTASASSSAQNGTAELELPPTKQRKRHGLWTEPDQTLDWGSYALGTCHAQLASVPV
uniref:Uncharacterized protein n=1 Tax=Anopheles dirus TaxID=7168 RepID=A0A182NJ56_9DIPT